MILRNNVLLVANFRPGAGYAWWLMENFWVEIAEICESNGRRCVLIYPKEGTVPAHIREAPIEVRTLDFENRTPRGLVQLGRLIWQFDIGAVYLTDKEFFDPLYAYMRVLGVSSIVLHNHIPGERPDPPRYRWLLKRTVHELRIFSCTLYIGVSKFVARRMTRVGAVPERRVTYIHNGIPISQEDSRQEGGFREELGIEPDTVLVVSVGRAHRYKGIHFLIDLAVRIRESCENYDVEFLHVGDGPHLCEFQAHAKERGLLDAFHFAGRRGDVPRILASSDIAVHVSHGEAFSLAILEYMEAGLPVIAPNHCGNAEAIIDGESGLLFEPRNDQQVITALCSVIRDREMRSRLGSSARARVRENFTLRRCNEQFRELITSALNLCPVKR